ncbi:Glycosyltransferase [Psidium guajava]|nr:Glycosyltransferase [Psidium guajava]
MLEFSRRLVHKGVTVTLATTKYLSKTLHGSSSCTSIVLEVISNGFDDSGMGAADSLEAYVERFWKVGPETLSELVERLICGGSHPTCIVYDSFLPWALDVALKFGFVAAAFSPCLVL